MISCQGRTCLQGLKAYLTLEEPDLNVDFSFKNPSNGRQDSKIVNIADFGCR